MVTLKTFWCIHNGIKIQFFSPHNLTSGIPVMVTPLAIIACTINFLQLKFMLNFAN